MPAKTLYCSNVNALLVDYDISDSPDDTFFSDSIPDIGRARAVMRKIFQGNFFYRLDENITERIGRQFLNWNQGKPEFLISRNDSQELRQCMDTAGKSLPLAVVAQIAYGNGAGHPYFGIHRNGIFHGEESHTYMYHATPGRVLKNNQASDYFRIDRISRKPMLYAFWILSMEITNEGSHEIHRRWNEHRYQNHNPYIFDCATFVTDIAKHMASVGSHPDNPFTYNIPSNTIYRGRPEDRGMRAILRNTHRPPALMLMSLDPATYEHVTRNSRTDTCGCRIINEDNNVFNVTSQ
jgi:hypothetical protein